MATEPWTYDKHLIILSRYDGSCPIQNIRFHTVKFWIQVHGLPVNRINEKTAYGIGESIGEVSRTAQSGELFGGNFLRIRVGINITRPLSRGRKVLLGRDREVWVKFKYEKLPNFCYWCGMVSHDAKECKVWLSSKGSLPLDQQEYGPWLRADPFSVGRRSVMFVPGSGGDFGGEEVPVRTGTEQERRSKEAAPPQDADTSQVDLYSEINQSTGNPGSGADITQAFHEESIRDCSESSPAVMPANVHTNMVSFEAQIQDIDMELTKFDNNNSCAADPGILHELSPSLPIDSNQVHACEKSNSAPPIAAHDFINDSRDLEENQLCLRTWKRLARLKQSSEESMQVPTLGKRPIDVEVVDEAEKCRKKIQISQEAQNPMVEAAEQPRQSQ